jgi:DNA phosphorothioation-associated putative methyltransferase
MGLKHWRFPREKTAIHHPRVFSIAASWAIREKIITPDTIVLDYGCGHRDDVALFHSYGFPWVQGWDPAFVSGTFPLRPANVVILSNVINVIEDVEERRRVLRSAFDLATRALVVTSYNQATGKKWGDGVVTSTGTFQKPYSNAGFRRFIWNVFGKTCICKKVVWKSFGGRANIAAIWRKEVPGL